MQDIVVTPKAAYQRKRKPPRPKLTVPLASRDERKAFVQAHGGLVPQRPPGVARWLVGPVIAPMITRLSRGKLGWCNASEPSLQAMAFIDTGYVYGDRSIGRWIGREVRGKRLLHKRIPPGAYFRQTGRWTKNGTQLNRWPSEGERRERLWRARIEKRKARAQKAADGQRQKRQRDEHERLQRIERRAYERAQQLVTAAQTSAETI